MERGRPEDCPHKLYVCQGAEGAKWAVNNKGSRCHPHTIATFPVTQDYPGCSGRHVCFPWVMDGGRREEQRTRATPPPPPPPPPRSTWKRRGVRSWTSPNLDWWVSLLLLKRRCLSPTLCHNRSLHQTSQMTPFFILVLFSLSIAFFCSHSAFFDISLPPSILFSFTLLTVHPLLPWDTYSLLLLFKKFQNLCLSSPGPSPHHSLHSVSMTVFPIHLAISVFFSFAQVKKVVISFQT